MKLFQQLINALNWSRGNNVKSSTLYQFESIRLESVGLTFDSFCSTTVFVTKFAGLFPFDKRQQSIQYIQYEYVDNIFSSCHNLVFDTSRPQAIIDLTVILIYVLYVVQVHVLDRLGTQSVYWSSRYGRHSSVCSYQHEAGLAECTHCWLRDEQTVVGRCTSRLHRVSFVSYLSGNSLIKARRCSGLRAAHSQCDDAEFKSQLCNFVDIEVQLHQRWLQVRPELVPNLGN